MLTINCQVVPQVLNFLILQVITQVFQDGFQFRDMTLPTLRKNEVIKNRNWYLKKMLVIFMHQLQLDETNLLHNDQKKPKTIYGYMWNVFNTFHNKDILWKSRIYLWFISGALSIVFKKGVFRRNLIIYYVNYIQFYLYTNPKCYFYVL